MKITGWIVFLAAAAAALAQATPAWQICRNPVRVFPGRATVDLTPLFQWWTRQPLVATNRAAGDTNSSPGEERPLSSWYRVVGAKVGTVGSSWVVDADLYTSPTVRRSARIILNHPPAVEEAQFNSLQAQLAGLGLQIDDARRIYQANTNAEAQAQALVERYRRSLSKVASDGVILYTRVAVQKHDAAATALNRLDQLEAMRQQLEGQLRFIPSAGGIYQVDWFAVQLGRSKQGVPIFDLGLVSATPP